MLPERSVDFAPPRQGRAEVGVPVGATDGEPVGLTLGATVGTVGALVGAVVGEEVLGATVPDSTVTHPKRPLTGSEVQVEVCVALLGQQSQLEFSLLPGPAGPVTGLQQVS